MSAFACTKNKYEYNYIMLKIRRLSCFDYKKLKKLISYLCTDDSDKLTKTLIEEPLGLFNAIMPLRFKFKSESFILTKDKEILGLITAICTYGNPYKINITRLIFKENDYNTGKQLVEFIIQKFGAKGAQSFIVNIDESHDELFDLFINGCGFRQCGFETLWKSENIKYTSTNYKYRHAQNSDSKDITIMYNAELNNIYKPALTRCPLEFREPLFCGFNKFYKSRFISENEQNIQSYFSITTYDNLNYILDITTNSGYDSNYDGIINSAANYISSKRKDFYLFIKQKNYIKESDQLENYLKTAKFTPIQTKHILIKDFYKPIIEENTEWKIFALYEGANIAR